MQSTGEDKSVKWYNNLD